MTDATSLLGAYANAVAAVEDHIEANKKTFEDHARLTNTVVDLRGKIEDAVAETGEGVSSGIYSVIVIPMEMKVYDPVLEAKLKEQYPNLYEVRKRPPQITITTRPIPAKEGAIEITQD